MMAASLQLEARSLVRMRVFLGQSRHGILIVGIRSLIGPSA